MRILICDDDVLIAERLREIVLSYKFEVVGVAHNKIDMIKLIETTQPDLALLDIRMKGKNDGIDLGEYIANNHNFGFIYVTAHSDVITVDRALNTKPVGYLVKPFEPIDVYTAISIALHKMESGKTKTHLSFKDGASIVNLEFYKILYLKSDDIYIMLQANDRSYLLRTPLKKIIESLPPKSFVRIHRSFIVNISKVEQLKKDCLLINGEWLPVSRMYYNHVKELMS